jgi:hypothetical protein
MCLKTHVADETKTTTMQFLLEQCLNCIYQVQFHRFHYCFQIISDERINKNFEFSHQTV